LTTSGHLQIPLHNWTAVFIFMLNESVCYATSLYKHILINWNTGPAHVSTVDLWYMQVLASLRVIWYLKISTIQL
jgi:hypothetical protein